MQVRCPRCGAVGELEEDRLQSLSAGRGAWSAVDVVEPTREASVTSDVLIPMLQSLVSAGVMAMILGVVGVRWQMVVGGAGLVMAVVWAVQLRQQRASSTKVQHFRRDVPAVDDRLEVWVGRGGGGDGSVPVGAQMRRSILPARSRLRVVFREVRSGRRQWSARSLHRCDGMSQSEASEMIEALVKAGLLRYRNGQERHPQGCELTEAGEAFQRRLLSE